MITAQPQVIVTADQAEQGVVAADFVADIFNSPTPTSVAVATGNSPQGLYAELVRRYDRGTLSTDNVVAYQLDEYLGLAPGDRRSLFGWMDDTFLRPLRISAERVVRLPTEGDLLEQCRDFDEQLAAAGGLDLAILGLGMNGHLGFNEPPATQNSPTRIVDLTPQTIAANAQYWGDTSEVPRQAVTMGLASLLGATCVVLLVSGSHKQHILHQALEGPITSAVPASYLQTVASVVVIADRLAWGE